MNNSEDKLDNEREKRAAAELERKKKEMEELNWINEMRSQAIELEKNLFDLLDKREEQRKKKQQENIDAFNKAFGNKPDYSEEQSV